MRGGNKWTPEEIALLFKYYEDFGAALLVPLFKQNGFPRLSRTIGQAARKRGLKYKGDHRGRFEKGHVPASKGKKMTPEMRAALQHTFYKKGTPPVCTTYVGDIRRRVRKNRFKSDGTHERYTWIKIAAPNVWELLHRHIWKKHYGEIPSDMIVVFKDNNPDRCFIENLEMITRKQHALRCQNPEKVKKTWDNPSDAQVLSRMKIKNPETKALIKNKPALVELVRQQIILKRTIKKIKDEKKSIVA